MKTAERLEQLLEAKDAEIERLSTELETALDRREKDWEWAEHLDLGAEHHPELPIPRLEMEWKKDGETWQTATCFYHLIYRHTIGHVVGVPMGNTTSRGGSDISPASRKMYKDAIYTPFRDGVHIARDSESLNLPAFVICEDRIDRISMVDGKTHQEPFRP